MGASLCGRPGDNALWQAAAGDELSLGGRTDLYLGDSGAARPGDLVFAAARLVCSGRCGTGGGGWPAAGGGRSGPSGEAGHAGAAPGVAAGRAGAAGAANAAAPRGGPSARDQPHRPGGADAGAVVVLRGGGRQSGGGCARCGAAGGPGRDGGCGRFAGDGGAAGAGGRDPAGGRVAGCALPGGSARAAGGTVSSDGRTVFCLG